MLLFLVDWLLKLYFIASSNKKQPCFQCFFSIFKLEPPPSLPQAGYHSAMEGGTRILGNTGEVHFS